MRCTHKVRGSWLLYYIHAATDDETSQRTETEPVYEELISKLKVPTTEAMIMNWCPAYQTAGIKLNKYTIAEWSRNKFVLTHEFKRLMCMKIDSLKPCVLEYLACICRIWRFIFLNEHSWMYTEIFRYILWAAAQPGNIHRRVSVATWDRYNVRSTFSSFMHSPLPFPPHRVLQ